MVAILKLIQLCLFLFLVSAFVGDTYFVVSHLEYFFGAALALIANHFLMKRLQADEAS